MCYNCSNLQSVTITFTYDLWVSGKWIHHSKPRLQVTNSRNNIIVLNVREKNPSGLSWLCNRYILHTVLCTAFDVELTLFWLALQPLWALASFQFPDLITIGRTPWTCDQPAARPLPKHRTAQTQKKHIYIPNMHVLSGIRTHDHGVRASEDSSYVITVAGLTNPLLC
jgi:hypothetical protein